MQIVYALLCLIGTALPLAHFVPWLAEHGADLPLLLQHAWASPVSAFAWSDVLVSAAVLVALIVSEGRRLGIRRPWWTLLGLIVGVSLALPLFLWWRERHLRRAVEAPA